MSRSEKNGSDQERVVLWSMPLEGNRELRLEVTADPRRGQLVYQDLHSGEELMRAFVALSYQKASSLLGLWNLGNTRAMYVVIAPYIQVPQQLAERMDSEFRSMRYPLDAPVPEGAVGEPGSAFLAHLSLPWYERGAYPTRQEFLDLAAQVTGSHELGFAWTQRPLLALGDMTPWELYDDGRAWRVVELLLSELDLDL